MGTVDIFRVSCKTVQKKEDIGTASYTMANPWPLLQQAFLPCQLPTPDTCVQVLRFLGNEISFGKQISNSWSAVAPVDKFILSLDGLAKLWWPVAILLLFHEEIHALPHQLPI